MKLIGIAGTDGSGKDTVAELVTENYGWIYISVSDILRDEAKRRGLALKRNILRDISAEWRREHGMGVLVDMADKEFKAKHPKSNGLAIASLRNPGEADRVHELGGAVVWVDADPKIRYQRIYTRNRGTEDQITFKHFLAEERAQMSHGDDDATLNLMGVKAKADIFIENNSSNLKAFKKQAEQALRDFIDK